MNINSEINKLLTVFRYLHHETIDTIENDVCADKGKGKHKKKPDQSLYKHMRMEIHSFCACYSVTTSRNTIFTFYYFVKDDKIQSLLEHKSRIFTTLSVERADGT